MCKSSSLAFVLLFAFLFRLEHPSVRLVLIILTMTIGVIMMVAGETAFNAFGFILVISASFFSGFRWALTQILLLRNPATSNPFSSIFYLAPIMFLSLLVIALPVEGVSAVTARLLELVSDRGILQTTGILLFPGLLAFLMTSSEFALLQRTSVVTLSICGIFKEVVTISGAGIVFHDALTVVNLSGLIVTIASIAAYNYLKIKKMTKDAHVVVKVETRPSSMSEEEGEEAVRMGHQPSSSFPLPSPTSFSDPFVGTGAAGATALDAPASSPSLEAGPPAGIIQDFDDDDNDDMEDGCQGRRRGGNGGGDGGKRDGESSSSPSYKQINGTIPPYEGG